MNSKGTEANIIKSKFFLFLHLLQSDSQKVITVNNFLFILSEVVYEYTRTFFYLMVYIM